MSALDLHAETVEALPDRVALFITLPTLGISAVDPSTIAGFWSGASGAAGNAEQTAPVTQALTTPPTLPSL